MGKKISIVIISFFSVFTQAQNLVIGERKGLLKATGSFYKANMLNKSVTHYYVGGNAEYFFDNKYSFRGDIYTLIGEKNDPDYFMNGTTQLSAGFNRNFTVNKCTPFIGIYTGMTQLHLNSMLQTFAPDYTHPKVQYIPHVGLTIGAQYYFYKYFHFFAEARYIHQLNPFKQSFLDEISYSAGLGFQIPSKK